MIFQYQNVIKIIPKLYNNVDIHIYLVNKDVFYNVNNNVLNVNMNN